MAATAASTAARVCIVGGGAAGFYCAVACAEAAAAARSLGCRAARTPSPGGTTCTPAAAVAARPRPLASSIASVPMAGGSVLVLERSSEVLHKVRVSGGGRCNVTHGDGGNFGVPVATTRREVDAYPRGAELIEFLTSRHGPKDTVRWFEAQGVPLKLESDGRVFPRSDSSKCIVRCLMDGAEALGVEVRRNAKVVSIQRLCDENAVASATMGARFRLAVEGADSVLSHVTCSRVILCCGSAQKPSVRRLLDGLCIAMRPTAPSLFSLLFEHSQGSGLHGLSGLSVSDASVEVVSGALAVVPEATLGEQGLTQVPETWPAAERGAVLVTHVGLSGPAILRLSAWGAFAFQRCAYHARLRVNWAPFVESVEDLADTLRLVPCGQPGKRPPRRKPLGEVSPWPGCLPARLWRRLVERSAWPAHGAPSDVGSHDGAADLRMEGAALVEQPWGRFRKPDAALELARRVWPQLTSHEIMVSGRRVNKEEFVTAGGIDWRKEIDWGRMESTVSPGLHFAGEVLDVDGITGGFNFQNCWTTGYIAGHAAAEALLHF